jgi:hypothetical protein
VIHHRRAFASMSFEPGRYTSVLSIDHNNMQGLRESDGSWNGRAAYSSSTNSRWPSAAPPLLLTKETTTVNYASFGIQIGSRILLDRKTLLIRSLSTRCAKGCAFLIRNHRSDRAPHVTTQPARKGTPTRPAQQMSRILARIGVVTQGALAFASSRRSAVQILFLRCSLVCPI